MEHATHLDAVAKSQTVVAAAVQSPAVAEGTYYPSVAAAVAKAQAAMRNVGSHRYL